MSSRRPDRFEQLHEVRGDRDDGRSLRTLRRDGASTRGLPMRRPRSTMRAASTLPLIGEGGARVSAIARRRRQTPQPPPSRGVLARLMTAVAIIITTSERLTIQCRGTVRASTRSDAARFDISAGSVAR